MIAQTKRRRKPSRSADSFRDIRKPEARSELGNAKLFAATYAGAAQFSRTSGRWLFYDGADWTPDTDGEAVRRAIAVVEQIFREARALREGGTKNAALRWAAESASRKGITAMLKIARDLLPAKGGRS